MPHRLTKSFNSEDIPGQYSNFVLFLSMTKCQKLLHAFVLDIIFLVILVQLTLLP